MRRPNASQQDHPVGDLQWVLVHWASLFGILTLVAIAALNRGSSLTAQLSPNAMTLFAPHDAPPSATTTAATMAPAATTSTAAAFSATKPRTAASTVSDAFLHDKTHLFLGHVGSHGLEYEGCWWPDLL